MKTQISSKKSILITGGGGDWAQSFANEFSDAFDITLVSRQQLDVTRDSEVASYFEDKVFDVVINNAGCIHPNRLLESDSAEWIQDISVNLIGTYLVSKYALKNNQNTLIINISSTAGFNAYKDWSSYCSSKAGVITLSKSMANDGFEVICMAPGAIETKFRDKFNIPNNNIMTCSEFSKHVVDVLNGQYQSGDVLFIRKNEFVLNP